MIDPSFIHLRVHTAYSLSEGAIKLSQLVELCKLHEYPAVAVTDTNNLFGALEFAHVASQSGIQPIIGTQMDVAREGAAAHKTGGKGEVTRHDRLVLLVKDEEGYENLMEITSNAFLTTDHGDTHTTLEKISQRSDGLLCLSGGPDGPLGRLVSEGQGTAAEVMCKSLAKIFPGRFYIEIQRHGTTLERQIEAGLLKLAYDYDIPLVATNDAYFSTIDMHEAHDALLCIAGGTYVVERDRRRLTKHHHFKSADEMRELFADLPEAIDNTVVIAKRCAYMPMERDPILPPFEIEGISNEEEALRLMAKKGLDARLKNHVYNAEITEEAAEETFRPYRERLEFELNVIIKMGFSGYFLIVADFIQWSKEQGIPVGPGRGSGAGSVVAWALTITDLDPLKFGLLFERFLNPERVSMPDFDVDFCQDRRDEVIRYVQDKYGEEKVAQIITFGKLQARAVLRDVGRVLGMPYGQVDKITKLVPFNPAHPPTLQEAIDGEPQLQSLREDDESVAQLIDHSLKLEGLFRHASTHAAGVIIGDRRLAELVPLYKDPRSDMPATQFSMKYAESAGLVKFDFLGLKTLTVLQRAIELIAKREAPPDLLNLPLSDKETFAMLSKGDTVGVFQLESSGMRDVLRNMRPDTFEDIIALVALYRPGPMDNIPRYIACKHGEEEPDYLYPTLQPILEETYGVMIYQEQVMQIAQVLSGYSLGSADLLRRAMGKKIASEMEAQRNDFVEGAVGNGVDRAKAGLIFDQVDKFAGYGFNKSHAAAYALVAYQTAYLKANYPVEFLAASMTLDLGNTDKLNAFRQELDRLKIPLLPPDINKSGVVFGVESIVNGATVPAVRYALAAIKNVGRQAMDDLVAERSTNGDYADLADYATRLGQTGANKRQFENLVRAGALDSLDANRKRLFEGAESVMRLAVQSAQERSSGQESLFDAVVGEDDNMRLRLPDTLDWPLMERLTHEFEAVGSYLSAHPLDAYAGQLRHLRVTPANELTAAMVGTSPKVAGVVISRQERTSAKGNRFAFVQLSDSSGVFEVVLFSELLSTSRELLESGQRVLLNIEIRAEGDGTRLSATKIRPLDEVLAAASTGLKIVINDERSLPGIQHALNAGQPGKCKVVLIVGTDNNHEVEIDLPKKIALTGEFRAAVAYLPGVEKLLDA
ncbi:MAG: DNA polymerase III subunit alpha [Alphaproteobacteria bacterium MarineAlpha11_Bin1]|nr:MAG: DNA polymerase III subunit alpha [Alphaproteobacteria bacterium MarineAlpha11_Bin1]|tara:strand:- start:12770 stop:16249 length:3480 start_codon:yes stop_codon:yes gene_type:complete